MIDSGSSVNIIKIGILKDTPIDVNDTLILKGITDNVVQALSSVTIKIIDEITKFYIVNDNFNISSDDIIGTHFLKENNAIIDYNNEYLLVGNN